MASTVKNRNAFAILHEESKILRRKEKKERAEERKLIRDQQRQERLEKKLKRQEVDLKSMKWHEVVDEDDDDEEEHNHDEEDDEDDNLSQEDSNDEGDGHSQVGVEEAVEKPEEVEVAQVKTEDFIKPGTTNAEVLAQPAQEEVKSEKRTDCGASSFVVPELSTTSVSVTQQSLTKKERLELEKKQLEELQNLLQNYGLNVPTNAKQESQDNNDQSASRLRRRKKKKGDSNTEKINQDAKENPAFEKPNDAPPATSTTVWNGVATSEAKKEEIPTSAVLSRDELTAATKSKAKTKKSRGATASVSEAVMAEAKKKSQLQKSKEKKEKFKFRH